MGSERNPQNARKAYKYLSKSPEVTPEERERLINLVLNDLSHRHLIDLIKNCNLSKEEFKKALNIVYKDGDTSLILLRDIPEIINDEIYEICINKIIEECEEEIKECDDSVSGDIRSYHLTALNILKRVKLKEEHKNYFIDKLCESQKVSYYLIYNLFVKEDDIDNDKPLANTFTEDQFIKIINTVQREENAISYIFDLHKTNIREELLPLIVKYFIITNDYKLAYNYHLSFNGIHVPDELIDTYNALIITAKLKM